MGDLGRPHPPHPAHACPTCGRAKHGLSTSQARTPAQMLTLTSLPIRQSLPLNFSRSLPTRMTIIEIGNLGRTTLVAPKKCVCVCMRMTYIVIGNLGGQGGYPTWNATLSAVLSPCPSWGTSQRRWASGGTAWLLDYRVLHQPCIHAGAVSRADIPRIKRNPPSRAFFRGKPGLVSVSGRNRLSVAPAQEPARACGVCVRAVALL